MAAKSVLTVGVDARTVNRDHLRGIGRYVARIVEGLVRKGDMRFFLFCDRPHEKIHIRPKSSISIVIREFPGYRFRTWEQLFLPYLAIRHRCDALFCPANTAPLWQPVPTAVTIHDTIIWDERFEKEDPRWYAHGILPSAFHKAREIITISRNSRKDILRLWPGLEKKTTVIYHGIADSFLKADPPDMDEGKGLDGFGITEPYMLYVGGGIARKRLDWALKVWKKMPQWVNLVTVGVPRDALGEEAELGTASHKGRIVVLPFVPDEWLPVIYRRAACILYPSLYEGFGFPVLEAHAVGTTVLHSASGSLAELAGPCSVVLPAGDLAAWVDAARRCVEDAAGGKCDGGGPRWAAGFDWGTSVSAHREIFRRMVEMNRNLCQVRGEDERA